MTTLEHFRSMTLSYVSFYLIIPVFVHYSGCLSACGRLSVVCKPVDSANSTQLSVSLHYQENLVSLKAV